MPVIDRLQRLGKVRQISAVPPPDVVFATIRRIFEVRTHRLTMSLHFTFWCYGKHAHLSAIHLICPFFSGTPQGVSRVPLPDRTLAMIKPDAVYHGAAAAIIAAIEADDFVIVGQIKRNLTRAEAETFYAEHKGKVFFERLINFMTSGTCALQLEVSLWSRGCVDLHRLLMSTPCFPLQAP